MFKAPTSATNATELLNEQILAASTKEEKFAIALSYVKANCHEKLSTFEDQANRIVGGVK